MSFRAGKFDRDRLMWPLRGLCPLHALDNIYQLDLQELRNLGKKLILLDVDNTLVGWRANEISEATYDLVNKARGMGFQLCIISNTRNVKRLEKLSGMLGIPFKIGKFKPSTYMYKQALYDFKAKPEETIMIGDQLFTDVLGANRAGIDSIWVKQMTPRDFIGTKISRFGERLLRLALYRAMSSPAAANTERFLDRPVVKQFVKFAIVGVSSMVIDLGLHRVLMFSVPYGSSTLSQELGNALQADFPALFGSFAKPIDAAFPVLKVPCSVLAIFNSFYWNRRWTFDIQTKEDRHRQLVKFFVIALVGMVLNVAISTGLNAVIPGHPRRSWLIASGIATVVVAFWNFFGQKLWTFRQKA